MSTTRSTLHGNTTEHHPLQRLLLRLLPRGRLALWEILLFGLICSADMISTAYWYLHGVAKEANPLLAYWLQRSVTAFCIAKMLSFVPLLVLCAIYRDRHRRLITIGLRIAIMAYIAIYLISVGAQFI